MKLPKRIKLLLIFCTALLCSGCWDKQEFDQLALAQAIGIDYLDDGQYQLTLQLIMPKASEETVSSDSLWIIEGQGASVGEALEQISLRAPREIYLDHLDIVLLGEALMRHDIDPGLEYLLKQNVLRRRTNLLAVEGQAGDILQAKPELAEVDIFYLSNLLKDQKRRERKHNANINDYYLKTGNALKETLVIPKVEPKGEKELQLMGGALLRDGVLVRWVDTDWMADYRWSTGAQEVVTLKKAGPQQQDITLEIHKSGWKWQLLSEQPLRVQANVKGTLYIVENHSLTSNDSFAAVTAGRRQVEQMAQKRLKEQIEKTIAEAQQDGCDAFGLGQWLRAWHPHMIKEDWPAQFAEIDISVQLKTKTEPLEYR